MNNDSIDLGEFFPEPQYRQPETPDRIAIVRCQNIIRDLLDKGLIQGALLVVVNPEGGSTPYVTGNPDLYPGPQNTGPIGEVGPIGPPGIAGHPDPVGPTGPWDTGRPPGNDSSIPSGYGPQDVENLMGMYGLTQRQALRRLRERRASPGPTTPRLSL